MATTYTVVKGDTLSEIASAKNVTVANLVEWNDITDPDYIVVGQVLYLEDPGTTTTSSSMTVPIIKAFGLQSNTDRTMYVTWKWDQKNVENYMVRWYYSTGDGIAFLGEDTTTEFKQATYSAPSNATRVKVKIKPVSEKHKVNGKDTSYWTASWSTVMVYSFSDNPPNTPPTPSVELDDLTLTARVDNIDTTYPVDYIQFHIVKNDEKTTWYNKSVVDVEFKSASFSCAVSANATYKVRCRAVRGDGDEALYSDWTEYTANVKTRPGTPKYIYKLRARSETSVYIDWSNIPSAESYEVQYTTQKTYFDSSPANVSSVTIQVELKEDFGHAEITGLESGQEYFFRVRASNTNGTSDWGEIKSIKLGTAPDVPTTWSSTTTAVVGEDLILYWTHNSEDGSKQRDAVLELIVDGETSTVTIENPDYEDEDEEDTISQYKINTSSYSEGATIKWRVKTRGIIDTYSSYSTRRTVKIYAKPTLELSVSSSAPGTIESGFNYPIYISGTASPDTQKPLGYHVVIKPQSSYDTVDQYGNDITVNKDQVIYSKYFDSFKTTNTLRELDITLTPGDVHCENNVTYNVEVTVTMNSGLTATSVKSFTFDLGWVNPYITYGIPEPNAKITFDRKRMMTFIRPYCINYNDELVSDVKLSVYRRDYDGGFTTIGTNITNREVGNQVYWTDPHPPLNYARYRIVAIDQTTGSISYYDMPNYPIGGDSVIIQWDEEWSSYDVENEDEFVESKWYGSMIKIPYNVDVSDSYNKDTTNVEYIGREHPVDYYGTHIGQSATWNMEIPKTDEETLYALRRLARWMGTVYVREPSGSGYWANISVSFSQKHKQLTIPVTLDVTRVEGGR